ncbi:MAG: nitrogenase cofactor biosynthesis protein NifB [Breznakiellaceae bacterium]
MHWERHPCFDESSRHRYGRVHLPVAPRCNIQCNYCNRDFDCAHESRPGVCSKIMEPAEAPEYVEALLARFPELAVVGIAGPGDPFANPEETLKTLSLIHGAFPDLLLCVATNGLNLAPYVGELVNLGVSHVTITINTINPSVGQRLYAWVRKGKQTLNGYEAAAYLLQEQLSSIPLLKRANILVKVNTVLVPGINEHEVGILAQHLASLGVDIMNILPLYPVKGTPFARLAPPSSEMVQKARERAGAYLPQMYHCTRCRADAAGFLDQDLGFSQEKNKEREDKASGKVLPPVACQKNRSAVPQEKNIAGAPQTGDARYRIAVATYEGLLVNQHLGEANRVQVYRLESEGWVQEDERCLPPRGGGDARWSQVAEILGDCDELWVAGIGENPRRILEKTGLVVRILEGFIHQVLEKYRPGESLEYYEVHRPHRCGEFCGGSGTGCG